MKICHEVPLHLLDLSLRFNDYDYALVHHFEDCPEYFNFFKKSLDNGREVILDNSLYELGEAFDMERYAYWIKKLNPSYYIAPDTFWDGKHTMEQYDLWMDRYGKDIAVPVIGVAQGKNYQDLVDCYRYMNKYTDKVAFTFKFHPDMKSSILESTGENRFYHEIFLKEYSGGLDDESSVVQSLIRYLLLYRLQQDEIINPERRHHLLGLQNTLFLDVIANSFPWIESIDTSNPICCAFENIDFKEIDNLAYIPKPTATIDQWFNVPLKDLQEYMGRIQDNTEIFRKIVRS